MPHSYRAAFIVSFAGLVLVLAQLAGISGATAQQATPPANDAPVATETPPTPLPTPLPPPVTAFLDGEAVVDTLPAGPATINASTVVIAPRVALRAVVTTGPVLILVDSGLLTIDADAAIVGPPPSGLLSSLQPAATPAPAPAVDSSVPDGNQILLPANTRIQLRNTTDEEVVLRVISIAPEGQTVFGQPRQ